MTRSLIVLAGVCLLLCNRVTAQLKNETFLREHLSKNSYDIDPEASTVILNETQSVEIVPSGYSYEQVYHCYKAVKILKQSGNQDADIFIGYQRPTNLTGATYNLNGNDIVKTPLPDNAVYNRKVTELVDEVRFSLSSAKIGSIIEYSYDIITPISMLLPPWNVQEESPKLFSKYSIEAPRTFNYTVVTQGGMDFKNYASETAAMQDSSMAYNVISQLVDKRYSVVWVKRNIPPMHSEPFISALINHVQRMDFQLAGIMNRISTANALYTTWAKLNNSLIESENFGEQINGPNRFLDPLVDNLTYGNNSQLQKVKNIFDYVRTNFSCSRSTGVQCSIDNAKLLKSKRGTVADINLLLVAILKHAGIEAEPVILSKLGSLKVNKDYPLLNRFNYTICTVLIDSQRYFLDASDKFNPFNALPHYCYNGYARVVVKGAGEELNLLESNIVEKTIYAVNIHNFTDSTMEVDVTEKFGLPMSATYRKRWDEDSSLRKKYFDDKADGFTDNVVVSNIQFLNLDNPDTNLIIKYTLSISGNRHDTYYLNGQLIKFFKENPFKENNRHLPIELPYKMDYKYILTMQLPKDMDIVDIPKSVDIKYGSGEMDFKNIVNYDSTSGMLMINASYRSNETNYQVESYSNIKKFFEKMIQEENGIVTLKKKKV
ncbi:MAG: transglutaminase domain-containing protein [Flavipsychrobacter sp.]